MFNFSRLSFARHFLLESFLILLVGMLTIGAWMGQQIEQGVLQRTAALTALYVDSLVAHHMPNLTARTQIDDTDRESLNTLFRDTSFSKQIIDFKLWRPDGRILYSTDSTLDGQTFPVQDLLQRALQGTVQSRITALDELDNASDRKRYSRLIETYAPVRAGGTGSVVAVAEFYQVTDGLDREVGEAQQRSWAVVGLATLAMYLLLAGLVGRASRIITKQYQEREEQVKQLTLLLEQNAQLSDRVHRAAARATAFNERFLRRLASELHDGPCQDLGLALLRVDSLPDGAGAGISNGADGEGGANQDHLTIQAALQSALTELRTISTGLWLPALEPLSPIDVAERAVRDYERKTGARVPICLGELPPMAPLPVKIALYRLLQEALSNGFHHAPGAGQRVYLWENEEHLFAQIVDTGGGFDPTTASLNGHLGLAGMRERVELLGGAFELHSTVGLGTTVQARIPLMLPEEIHG